MIDNIKTASLFADSYARYHKVFAAAESCTGGLIAAAITEIPGSSKWFDRSFVTYSNEAKQELLGVRKETLEKEGAVSCETVRQMVTGALKRSHADIAVAVSGIAGPDGGTVEKPVGTVWVAFGIRELEIKCLCLHLKGNRSTIRDEVVDVALRGLLSCAEGNFLPECR